MKIRQNANQIVILAAITVVALLIIVGCSNQNKSQIEQPIISDHPLSITSSPVIVIYDSEDYYGGMCYEQTKKALKYGKIPFDSFDLSSGQELPALSNIGTIAVATEMLWKMDSLTCLKIQNYVKSGGGLAVLFRTWNEYLTSVFGVLNKQEPVIMDEETDFHLIYDFLPGGKDVCFCNEDVSYFLLNVQNKAQIIASTGIQPIVWIHNFGKGKVIYWNTGLLARKINRGFITISIAAVQPATAVVIADVGLFDIDDYPNSSSNQKLEPIKSEFNLTISEFYVLRWYPDMLRLAKRFSLKFSSVVVFNYNGQTTPPYRFYEWLHGEIKLGGKKIRSSQFAAQNLTGITELGLHGYNHQPLTMENWKNTDNMKLALMEGRKRWQVDNLGEFPFFYIPPLNIYDSTGVNVLQQVFPSIKEVGALYLGHFEKGQFREYGADPWNKNLYVIPRNTSGYILTDFFKRSMISLLNSNGIWAHFVHPDDVYPLGERYSVKELKEAKIENLTWHGEPQKDGLYYQLGKWLNFAKAHYPWLRYMTRKQAYNVMQNYDKTKIALQKNNNTVNIEVNVVPSVFAFYLREKNNLKALVGGEVLYQYTSEFGEHFIIKAIDMSIQMQFEKFIK